MMIAAAMSMNAWAQRANPVAQDMGAPTGNGTPVSRSSAKRTGSAPDSAKSSSKSVETLPRPAAAKAKATGPIPPPTFSLRSSSTFGDYSPGAYFRNILGDQKRIWMSPERARPADAFWLAPLVAIGGSLLATDTNVSRRLTNSPSVLNQSSNVSWAAVGALIGAAGGLYLLGKIKHNRHQQETGFLSMESLANALIVNNAINFAAGRERPTVDNADGKFWQNGRSFPSNHAVAAWSVASVMAHEYPGILSKLVTYGLAATTSAERVRAKQHFPADVFVGSALGYLVGQQVYRDHHDPSVGGTTWNTFSELAPGESHNPANYGSPYVPVGSWIYPAFERLAGMGYIRSEMLGMRPWTRLECARLLLEAQDRLDKANANPPEVAVRTYEALRKEFQADIDRLGGGSNNSAELESLYTRVTEISGKPLKDGYHFGQTLINDYGRPYQEGTNAVAGFTSWGTAGPMVGYVDAEYQHSPSGPPLPASARAIIPTLDYGLPPMPAIPTESVNRMDLLQGYVGFAFHNWEITAGKQSLWMSPAQGGSMMFSNNAEPIDMVQINRVSPFKLPGFLGFMGPIRGLFFVGQLHGDHFTFTQPPPTLHGTWAQPLSDQPLLDGVGFSFKPTPNVEFGFLVTSIFGGTGMPVTMHTFARSLFSLGNALPGAPDDPGDKRSGFNLNYRLPFLRNWVTFYTDSFTDDEFSPVAYWDRAANSAGLYFDRLPGLPNFDLRLEGVYTDNPIGGLYNRGFYYSNVRYRNGYTNDGNLIGSWIGRQSQGEQAWLTYWATPRNYIQLQYRHQKIGQGFLPGGGTINDGGLKADWWFKHHLEVSGLLQYERWDIPILAQGQQTDFTTQLGVTYWPRWRLH
jgi:membrane-associated phospholipid phosphatase